MNVRIDDAIEIKKPEIDSHFRLVKCPCCSGDNVAYVKYLDKGSELWRVSCFDCGHTVNAGGAFSMHDIQMRWNGIRVTAGNQTVSAARAAG